MNANPLNAVNRGVYISDNLPFLKSLNDECVDLVCIDPPFAKNETFGRKNDKSPDPLKPPLSDEEKETELALLRRWGIRNEQEANDAGIDWPATRYKDIWSWQDVHEEWLKDIEDDHPGVHKLIEATQEIHGEGTAAYLCYMAVRLFEIRRVLKDTGSLYLHCDHTAGAYLRQLLDAVFGKGNFRNEISWCSTSGAKKSQHQPKRFGVNHETIFFYSRDEGTSVRPYKPLTEAEITEKFIHTDESGRRYFTKGLSIFRRPAHGPRPNLCYEWRGFTNKHLSGWCLSKERLEEEFQKGNIVITQHGTLERRKYLEDYQGSPVSDIWDDIPSLTGTHLEKTGYPTQKPVALAERIIKASCPEGGVVLDCFAGCAYVAIAAERLNRNWIACDINPRAWTVFKRQFAKPKLAPLKCAEPMPTDNMQQLLFGNIVTVHGPDERPVRETPDRDDTPPALKLQAKPRVFKVPASVIPEDEMLETLLNLSDYTAWCCGFANRKSNGDVVRTTRNFHLDHLAPKSKDGTSNEIHNRAPMCPYHNIRKSNRQVMLAEYRQEIAEAGELMVDSIDDLINLNYAQAQAMQIFGEAYARRNQQRRLPV